MSLIHPHGNCCATSELDLHALPVTQSDIVKSITTTKTTTNALTPTQTTFDFTFEQTNLYTDLSSALLYLEYKVCKADGTALANDSDAAPVNNILHSLFSSLQLLINGEKVTGNSEEYAFKAYLLTLLSNEADTKDTLLEGCVKWKKDTAGHVGDRGDNEGWVERRTEASSADTLCAVGHPVLDLMNQCKLLPSHCELKFIFDRSPKSFYMMGAANSPFFIKIVKAEMSIRQVQVRDEVAEVHNKAVNDPKFGPFNYPITRTRVTKHTLNGGSQDYSWTQADTTQIPSRVVLGFVKETSASGTITENPFFFQNFGVREVEIKYDEQKFELKTDFANKKIVKAYHQLFCATGLMSTGKNCDISYEEFKNGYTLFAFDLTPDQAPEDVRINLLKQGKLTYTVKFAAPTTHAVSVIILSFYDNLIQLNQDRLPVTDFHMT